MLDENNTNSIKTGIERYEDIHQYDENKYILIEQYRRKERRWYTIITIISAILVLGLAIFAIIAFWR